MTNEFKRTPTHGENDVDLRVATEPRRVTDAVLSQIIATKDGEIAALTAEVTHLAEKLAERDASAGLMKQASETTLADFGGNQANYDAWKKFQASAAPQPVDAAQAVPEYAMCNDKGAVGFAPDNFQECPDCVAARACAQEGPEAVYQVFDNCNGEQWLTVSKAVYDRADLDLRRCWQPTDTTKGGVMSALSKTIAAHFIHSTRGVLYKPLVEFAPRVGDELRFAGDKYFRVVRLVWVYDEPEAQFTRLNIQIEDAP